MLIANVALVFGLAFAVRGRIHDHEDYLVAGRRLGLPLASLTLFATWFGAGTLLVATDEIRHHGLRAAALDPIGAGACLLLAGAFLAAPLWRMRLLTLVDFFRVRFGPRAETLGAILMVPGYFGWIAAQFVALASLLELLFGLDLRIGLALVAAVGTGYTLIGGMWSVVVTDAVQATLLVLGLATLAGACLLALGDGDASAGLSRLLAETPPERLVLVPRETLQEALAWLGVLAAGALGNLPGQDLMQRVFSSRSAAVARRACLVAGGAYWIVGIAPMGLGLAAAILAPDDDASMLAILAGLLLHPLAAAAFVTAVLAAVLSTIDSALLAPAAVLAENLLGRRLPNVPRVRLDRACVLAVAAASLAIAHLGEDAWSLLESAYEVGLVSLLVPLVAGLASTRGDERAALAAMGVGTVAWLAHGLLGWAWFAEPLAFDVAGWPLPVGLSCAACAAVAYVAAARRTPRIAPLPDGGDPTS
ncbi:MAG TPA: sodium:solute symporter [Myxococcota bacterium]|nr:sodium:solute symporter [Myxococcota bacterium]